MRAGVIILLITVSMNDVLETPFKSFSILSALLFWAAFIGIMLLARKVSAPVYLALALTIIVGGSMLQHSGPGRGYATGSDYQLVQEIQRKQSKADKNAALDRSQVEIDGESIPMPPSRELFDRAYDGEVEAPTLAYLSQAAGTYWMATRARIDDFTTILLYGLVYFGWRTLGLFLIGAGLMKWGLASPANRGLWRKATWIGFGVGLPMTVIATVSWGLSYRAENILTPFDPILHDISSLFLAAGLAGMALLWGVSKRFGFLKAAFCNVGRMALSNYLGQSLVMSLLAGGYGLGWYGRLTHLELFGLAVLVFAMLTAVSTLWLSRFRYGPLEWIWRCGTYWAFLSPFKSKPA